ncbi:MAG: 30S ribosomal protein S2 [Candidatus Nealsonbacteria bacterium]
MPEKTKKEAFNIDLEEMIGAGLHLGSRTSKTNPKMKPYIYGSKNTIHIIDVEKTKEKLIEALDFIQSLIAENKMLLLVGTKVQIKKILKETAEACNLSYVSERWIGGTFTNFGTIQKRVEYYKDLEKKRKEGGLDKYTKKERAKFDKEIKDLEFKFEGLRNLSRIPDACFICDMIKDRLAVKEAKIKGVRVIGICDTNVDPSLTDYPIPANDDAISSVKYILDKVKEAILKTKTK